MWNFEQFKDNTAVITEEGRALTYAEFREMSASLSAFIPERCLIFVLSRNHIGSLLGYATFINNRMVPLMLEAGLDRELLWPLIETYKPDYLWVPADLEAELLLVPALTQPLLSPGSSSKVCSFWDYTLIKTPWSNVYPLNPDLALLLTTSGSTGSFKMVRQSYANIKANQEAIAEFLELDATERPITTLPMNYTYGLSVINSHLHVGAAIILTSKTLVQREFWQQFKDYKATSFAGVPYTYEMLNRLKFFTMELPSLATMTQAGGRLSPALHQKFAQYAQD
jgi:acyl-CoA synthetase (AMP-forming)/AMP-acid ligase II